MCLGQDGGSKDGICEKGTELKLVPCYDRDNRLNLFNWVDGKIKALHCGSKKNLCVDYKGKKLVLEDCDGATKMSRMKV